MKDAVKYDFLIVGGGIFGITTAIELCKRGYKVGLLSPDTIPHHLAASTDITKAVRMEYGSDKEYFRMAETSISRWKEWNEILGVTLYHEVGFLMLCKEKMESEKQRYERLSFRNLQEGGYTPERLKSHDLRRRFPAVNASTYIEASFNAVGGYVESARVVEKLADYARSNGVTIHEGQTVDKFLIEKGKLQAIKTREGQGFSCGHAIVAAGSSTPFLLPELQPYMKVTGHPVFWIRPKNPSNFISPKLCVFTADISNSGWYGFPFLPAYGIIKIAKHSSGSVMNPEKDDRLVTETEVEEMRQFLEITFPELTDSPLVYTRRCLYTDTWDGHFWIDQHPEIKGLSVSSGGSGHALKMAPLLGEMTADMAEGLNHQFATRHKWRHLTADSPQAEEARHVVNRRI